MLDLKPGSSEARPRVNGGPWLQCLCPALLLRPWHLQPTRSSSTLWGYSLVGWTFSGLGQQSRHELRPVTRLALQRQLPPPGSILFCSGRGCKRSGRPAAVAWRFLELHMEASGPGARTSAPSPSIGRLVLLVRSALRREGERAVLPFEDQHD